jgi:methyl-accepting chemotaxis protein
MLTGFMLCLAVTTAISLIATISSTSRALEERIISGELPAIVASVKADIQRRISEPLTSALDIASNHYLHKWEASGQPADGTEDFLAYAKRLKAKYRASSVYWVSTSNREYLTDSGSLGRLKPADVWFDQFLSSGKAFELGLGREESTRQLTLFVNARFNVDPRHTGLAGIGLPMEGLAKRIAEYRFGDTGSVMLVRADGTILVHRDADLADGQHRLSDLPGIGAASLSILMSRNQAFAHASAPSSDGERIWASAFMPELDAYVVAQVPTAELLSSVKRAAWTGPLLAAALSTLFASFMVSLLARAVAGPVRRAASMLNDISGGHGDLTRRMQVESEDEVGQLAIAFNRFVDSLHSMVGQVRDSAAHIASATGQLALGSRDLSARTEHASSALQQTAATMSELASQVRANATSTDSVAVLARTAHAVASRGSESMSAVEQSMARIDRSSQSVGEIITVIDDIALQTNLLALNAAVESARAGQHGRGFAVVAAEVRMLAARAAESSKEVRELVSMAQLQAHAGAAQTRTVNETMQQLLTSVSDLSGHVNDINENSQRQSDGIHDVNTAVAGLDHATQQNADLVEEVSVAADVLRRHAAVLSEAVGKFKLS